ncbi:MAG: phytanoyl-CoA dioxygenase family protein [Halothece sp.]
MSYQPIQLTNDQIASFEENGFLVIEKLIDPDLVALLKSRIEPLFHGEFETGIYPDEWHWRPGMSLPDITRQMCNAWKSDRAIASVSLSAEVGRLCATLARWPGARIGQDSLWYKPPGGGKEIALHQDGAYIDYLNPPEMVTCWIALDDTRAEIGPLEYARGSHKWPLLNEASEFHVPEGDHRSGMQKAAALAGVSDPEVIPVEVPAGGCAIHHGCTWHGSGKNTSASDPRRSLAVHTISSEAHFQPGVPAGYIYGRYQRVGELKMDESFFPILWTRQGYRSPHLAQYCQDAISKNLVWQK